MVALVVPLSQTQIDIAGQLHQRLEQWRLSDMALRRLRQALPNFDDETCLLKSIVVNQLYGTQVLAIIPMSRHVKHILSDVGATERGAELVDEIAAFTHNGKLRRCISFAAKFCHFFVDENRFPIYDEAVRQAIKLHIGDIYVSGNNAPYATFCNNLGRLLAAVGFRCAFSKRRRLMKKLRSASCCQNAFRDESGPLGEGSLSNFEHP
jgi:hypothetical protein